MAQMVFALRGAGEGDQVSVTLDTDDEQIEGLGANGRPDPAYALGLGMVPASAGKRSLAFLIELVAVGLLSLPLTLGALPILTRLVLTDPVPTPAEIVAAPEFVTGVIFYAIGQGLVSLFVIVQVIVHGIRGVTLGKKIMGLRSVNVARFTKPGFWRMLLRAIVFWTVLAAIPLIGVLPFLLSSLWDGEKRGRSWLDKIGRNWLIDIRRGLDPFDAKALRHARKRLSADPVVAETELPSLATGAAGAVPSFVPAARSSSGVIGARSGSEGPRESWQPPAVGVPAPTAAPTPEVVQPAPVSAPAPAPSPVPPPARPAASVAEPSVARPSVPEPSVAEPSVPVVSLRFDDGTRVEVTGTGLLGRAPEPGDGERVDHLVPLRDETKQLSKTHASFGLDAQGFWIVDRGSVNGTTVTTPGAPPRELAAWQRDHIPHGSHVEVGGCRFTVTEPTTPTNGDA